jgi:hypothetical protein
MRSTPWFCIALAGAALARLPAVSAKEAAVNVVVDLTAEGRKVAPPVPGHPQFYYPVMGGYLQMGAITAGEKPPAALEVAHLVAKALAAQGYFAMSEKYPPSLVLVIHWGYMNPKTDEASAADEESPTPLQFDQNQELALVAGHTLNNLTLFQEREGVMQGIERNRYFVVVSAYDLQAYLRKAHTKVLLWQAKMSVPSDGFTFDEVLPALVQAGQFGKETLRPQTTFAPTGPVGRVDVGTPIVQGYSNPASAPAALPAK